jgi:hypothetical protein
VFFRKQGETSDDGGSAVPPDLSVPGGGIGAPPNLDSAQSNTLEQRVKEQRVRVRKARAWRKSREEWSSSETESSSYEMVTVSSESEQDEDIKKILKEYAGPSIHDVLRQENHKKFDRIVRIQNLIIFIIALVSNCLMMAEVYIGWDEENRLFVETGLALACKIGCTATTIALIIALIIYYKYQLYGETHQWHVGDSVVWRKHLWKFLMAEIFVCSIHTFPEFGHAIYDDR